MTISLSDSLEFRVSEEEKYIKRDQLFFLPSGLDEKKNQPSKEVTSWPGNSYM